MRIGIDAMGGDLAPSVPVKGALAAAGLLAKNDELVLVGDKDAIERELDGEDGWRKFIRIVHASQVIGMSESPVGAIRHKPDSSIVRTAELAKLREVDAVISAGNTGAYAAACQMHLRRLRGVNRPGIAVVLPTYKGPVTMIDVGANVNCRPHHLHQYAVMATEYSKHICGVARPRVALLNIGQEDAKGSPLVKETRALLKADPLIDYVGSVEGRDLVHGACDVVVTEAFVGNVALKLIEGLSDGLFRNLLLELAQTSPEEAKRFEGVIVKIRERYDFNQYGGAPLLGVNGICIICHGASKANGITNAVRAAKSIANTRINERITERIGRSQGTADE